MLQLPIAIVLSLPFATGLATSTGSGSDALELERGDVICLLGNATAERMQHHGWLEVALQTRFPKLELSMRNLGFGADELTVHQRTMNFGKFSADGMEMNLPNDALHVPWDRYLDHCDADVVFAFFGYNESFAGARGWTSSARPRELRRSRAWPSATTASTAPRLVLFSSIPHEDTGDPEPARRGASTTSAHRALQRRHGRSVAAGRAWSSSTCFGRPCGRLRPARQSP